MTEIKIETDSDVCNALKEGLGGYTTAHGRKAKAEEGAAMLAVETRVRQTKVHAGERFGSVIKATDKEFTIKWDGVTVACTYDKSYLAVGADCPIDVLISPAPDPVRTTLADRIEAASGMMLFDAASGKTVHMHNVTDAETGMIVAALRAQGSGTFPLGEKDREAIVADLHAVVEIAERNEYAPQIGRVKAWLSSVSRPTSGGAA